MSFSGAPVAIEQFSDLSLLRRIARREAEALRQLYDRHASRVMALTLRVLRSRADAEEIVQEVFVEV